MHPPPIETLLRLFGHYSYHNHSYNTIKFYPRRDLQITISYSYKNIEIFENDNKYYFADNYDNIIAECFKLNYLERGDIIGTIGFYIASKFFNKQSKLLVDKCNLADSTIVMELYETSNKSDIIGINIYSGYTRINTWGLNGKSYQIRNIQDIYHSEVDSLNTI